jgi:hypothetical protein
MPGFLHQRVLAATLVSAGCGCDGCDKAPASAAKEASATLNAPAQPLVFYPRKPK